MHTIENSLLSRFATHAAKEPDKKIVFDNSRSYTYQKLDSDSENFGKFLARKLDGGERVVGICLNRSYQYLVSILACLKQEIVFISIEPKSSEESKRHILKAAKCEVVISSRPSKLKFSRSCKEVTFDEFQLSDRTSFLQKKNKRIERPPARKFCIYSTSGSTGHFNLCLHSETSFIERFDAINRCYPKTDDDIQASRTSVSFIPSMWELLGSVTSNIRLQIIDSTASKDVVKLVDEIYLKRVTRISLLPSLLDLILKVNQDLRVKLSSLKLIFCCGEPFSLVSFRNAKKLLPNVIICNDYGSTETNGTFFCDHFSLKGKSKFVPIGRPLPYARYQILDERLEKVPKHSMGGLYIDTSTVMLGYLGDKQLTAKKFVRPPFLKNQVLYDTGDIARENSEGLVELVGRKDQIVKIGGEKINCVQVQDLIGSLPLIENCFVYADIGKIGNTILVAIVGVRTGAQVDESFIRRHVSDNYLPLAVPQEIFFFKKFKYLKNGKADWVYLKKKVADIRMKRRKPLATSADTLSIISGMVEKILNRPIAQTIRETSFLELGMNSLMISHLRLEINKKFKTNLSVLEFFENPSVDRISNLVFRKSGKQHVS